MTFSVTTQATTSTPVDNHHTPNDYHNNKAKELLNSIKLYSVYPCAECCVEGASVHGPTNTHSMLPTQTCSLMNLATELRSWLMSVLASAGLPVGFAEQTMPKMKMTNTPSEDILLSGHWHIRKHYHSICPTSEHVGESQSNFSTKNADASCCTN